MDSNSFKLYNGWFCDWSISILRIKWLQKNAMALPNVKMKRWDIFKNGDQIANTHLHPMALPSLSKCKKLTGKNLRVTKSLPIWFRQQGSHKRISFLRLGGSLLLSRSLFTTGFCTVLFRVLHLGYDFSRLAARIVMIRVRWRLQFGATLPAFARHELVLLHVVLLQVVRHDDLGVGGASRVQKTLVFFLIWLQLAFCGRSSSRNFVREWCRCGRGL